MSMRPYALAASAALLLAAAPASASSSANASVTQFGYTLFDLNPGDGLTPSVTFALQNSSFGSYVQASTTDPALGNQANAAWSLTPLGSAATSAGVGLGSAQASVSGSPTAGSMSFMASGAALGSTVPNASTQFSASTSLANFSSLAFTLSPNTLIVFSGIANLRAETTLGRGATGFQSEQASASVNISTNGPGASGGQGNQSSSDSRSIFASFNSTFDPITGQVVYTGQTQTLSALPLSASFTNFTAGNLTGQLNLSVSVNGNSPLAPIPEPSSTALMLGGLLGLGAWLRRRR